MIRSEATDVISQAGVVPYHVDEQGVVRVLLISSRSGKRWLVPKGMLEPHLSPRASAAQEALEEAGVEGPIDGEPLGHYEYEKWGHRFRVELFPMRVTRQYASWQERYERERRWAEAEQAAKLVSPPELGELIETLMARA